MRTQVKFCGMTRAEDIQLAVELGVDAIGLVFVPDSPRMVTLESAKPLREAMPPGITMVALLMDAERHEVDAVIHAIRPTLLQFHGDEDDAFCASFGMPYLKALGMAGLDATQAANRVAEFPRAKGLLLDGHRHGERGGSGEICDWNSLPESNQPLWLAGGLHADNVGSAITLARPFAVDVSSGIEVRPGIKDARRMQAFLQAVRDADARLS